MNKTHTLGGVMNARNYITETLGKLKTVCIAYLSEFSSEPRRDIHNFNCYNIPPTLSQYQF